MATADRDISPQAMQRILVRLARMRVLIIDRHAGARANLRVLLAAFGVSAVHHAASSAEALRQVKNFAFDVIFSDYPLEGGRDGQQLLEELRRKRLISLSTVFMLITAERGYRNVVSVAELAPDDYLIKPFTAEQIQARLIRALYKKQFFRPVFEALDAGALSDALAACEARLAQEGAFLYDSLRLKGETLNALGRHAEAEAVFQRVVEAAGLPWASLGLAVARRGQDDLAGAERIAAALIEAFPDFMAAYDFLAGVREAMGRLLAAQEALTLATERSPHNSQRLREVGDVAVRNGDLATAERAYAQVLERHRGSSLAAVEDYANLARALIGRGSTEAARRLTQDLRREWRGHRPGELTALIVDSLCAEQAGEPTQARRAAAEALALHDSLRLEEGARIPEKIAIDLARACLAAGEEDAARQIAARIAAENHDNRALIAHIEDAFAKTGQDAAGQALLAEVGRDLVELTRRGAQAAQSGDLLLSARTRIEAAERAPNAQFLVEAAEAIFTLLDRHGWNEEDAQRGVRYLRLAHGKDPTAPRLAAARERYRQLARRYGIDAAPVGSGPVPTERGRG